MRNKTNFTIAAVAAGAVLGQACAGVIGYTAGMSVGRKRAESVAKEHEDKAVEEAMVFGSRFERGAMSEIKAGQLFEWAQKGEEIGQTGGPMLLYGAAFTLFPDTAAAKKAKERYEAMEAAQKAQKVAEQDAEQAARKAVQDAEQAAEMEEKIRAADARRVREQRDALWRAQTQARIAAQKQRQSLRQLREPTAEEKDNVKGNLRDKRVRQHLW